MKRPILHEHTRGEPCNAVSCRVAGLASRFDGWQRLYYEAWPEEHPGAFIDVDGIWRNDRRGARRKASSN